MIYFTPPDSNDSVTRIVLNNTEYVFHFSYNYHGDFWTMGVYENYDTPIVTCIKIVPEYPLGHFLKMAELPDGVIFVETTLERIGRKDFVDGNAQIVFVPNDELDAYVEAQEENG